jgi:hypothetical protein
MSRTGQMEGTFVTELRKELIFKLFVIVLLVYYYDLIGIKTHTHTSSIHTKQWA